MNGLVNERIPNHFNTLFRSTVPSGAVCSRSTKRLVRSPREVSYRDVLPGEGAGGTADEGKKKYS